MKAGEASNTAKVIAASTILLASDARTQSLVAPGAAEWCRLFLSGSRVDRLLAWSAQSAPTRALWRGIERVTLPGIMAHYWHRKRWIEARTRCAIEAGATRVIILGAGFDTLGLRLAREMPTVAVFEIDHPATQGAKLRALANAATTVTQNISFIARDLASGRVPLDGFDEDERNIVIIEGMLMYLSPPDVERLFSTLRSRRCGRAQVIFSFMAAWPDGTQGFRPRSWLIERWLAWRGEPFNWGVAPTALEGFLAAHGFRLTELALTREFTPVTSANEVMLDGEHLAVCEALRV